jgi:hypothetical protein
MSRALFLSVPILLLTAWPAAVPAATTTPKPAAAAQKASTSATMRQSADLKDKPFLDAKTLKKLPAGSSVVILERQGGWLKVTGGGQQGWVRLLQVNSQPATRGSSGRELESAAKVATGRAGSGNVVATTGIRGLNEEELRTAKPNPAELKKLEGYQISKERAAEYARKNGLAHRDVPSLPEPAP